MDVECSYRIESEKLLNLVRLEIVSVKRKLDEKKDEAASLEHALEIYQRTKRDAG